MERSPKRHTDKLTNDIFDFIFQNAMGSIIILNAIPTASQMKANTMGIYETTLYVKFANNVLLKFSGTVVT